jgi:transcriptional regulator with XRE-family HTH domain
MDGDDVSDLRPVFGNKILRARHRKRLSQRELDGVNQKTVSSAERGAVNLSLAVMEKLARAVGAEVATLLPLRR